jgi:hypothetical protein
LLGEGVVIEDKFGVGVDGEGVEGIGGVDILIILFGEEFVVGVVGIGEEALHPIEVVIIGDQSIIVFINSGEDLFEDGVFEVV